MSLSGGRLGPYELLAPIANGTSGTVYRARNTVLGREVAIKILNPETLPLGSNAASLRLFLNEAKVAAMLRHPHIVSVYDAIVEQDVAYIVMESVFNGRSLHRHCKGGDDQLSLTECLRIVRKCASALQHAHEQGIVHRDVKPRNILLDRGNEPRLGDFGLALTVRSDATMTFLLGAGSPLYMSPEQVLDENLSAQTDIFSLGVVLYELLTSTNPFRAPNISAVLQNVIERPHPPLRQLRADVPAPLEQIVNRAMAKQRARRYSTALDMASDLDLVLDLLEVNSSADQQSRKVDIARSLSFFSDFTADEVREVVLPASVRRYAEGQEVVAAGERSSSFFFLLEGEVSVRRGEREVARLRRGACVGEMAAITGRPRTAEVRALKPTVVLMVPRSVLDETTLGCRLKLKDAFLNLLVTRLESTLKLV
jgi:serine/threonine-protein kinase